MMKKLMMVLAAMVCMASSAKEGKIEMDFGYLKMRGRTHSDGPSGKEKTRGLPNAYEKRR